MRNRWNTREILSRNTDKLGLVLGFALVGTLAAFTVFVIIASR